MRLLQPEHWHEVFHPLLGSKVGLVDGHGNVGDWMIYRATRQLLDLYGVDWRPVVDFFRAPDVDYLLLFGGGNMGKSRYPLEVEIRRKALELKLPCIVLPQSSFGPEEGPFYKTYVREHYSKVNMPYATLVPDLALGLDHPRATWPATRGSGTFLRSTANDPTNGVHTIEQYIEKASFYQSIVTDRLHFAICGLMSGREVTLLPSEGYHKNQGMWEDWLANLGCKFEFERP